MTEDLSDWCANTPICKSFEEARALYLTIKPRKAPTLHEWLDEELFPFTYERGSRLITGPKMADIVLKSEVFATVNKIEICMEYIFSNKSPFTRDGNLESLAQCNEWIRTINNLYFKNFSVDRTLLVWPNEKKSMFDLSIQVACKLERMTTLIYSLVEMLQEQEN